MPHTFGHFQQPVAPVLTGRHQRGIAVGDEGEDGDVLRQQLAVVELERRHVALGIDLLEGA